jgi:tRNA dimethylallyltransferase
MDKKPLYVILGPTASGKTALAVALARLINGEIISADSRQIYRGLNIGTGKDLGEYEQGGEVVSYHVIDIVEVGEEYSVAHFQKDAFDAMKTIDAHEHTPILCGGTGLYLDAVLNQYAFSKQAPFIPQPLVLDRPTRVFGLNPPLELRRELCANRLLARLETGLVEEVKDLLAQGISADDLIWLGLEYKWLTLLIREEISYAEFVEKLTIAIQQFSKRQMTFFRKMERSGIDIQWIPFELSLSDKLAWIQARL